MLTCKTATKLIEKEETERLSLLTRMRLKVHLLMCGTCSDYKKQSQLLSKWIKNKKGPNVDTVELSADSKAAIIKKMKKKQLNL